MGARRVQTAATAVPAMSVADDSGGRRGVGVQGADQIVASREEHRRTGRVPEPDPAHVLRPVALGGEQDAAADDRDRAEHERRAQRLVEDEQRDQDRDERRGADHHGGARRPDLTHGEREEDLRPAGSQQAGE